ncbi:endonuclease domain-containing protein [Robertkochia flava]|uniref:endonuclease domain-containing protein n=1 Tax=Robertkochia flava TaxID=3447986 RepID=UPI001CC93CE4|nr:endonuclease domain-containing protein [Robertkochia marina]
MKKTEQPYHDLSMSKGAKPETFLKAQQLRKNLTKAEKCLKAILDSPPFDSYNFRCQHPLGIYILDFYSHSLKMVIEVDGPYHSSNEQILADRERTTYLESYDLKVIRFTNRMVLNNAEKVKAILITLIKPGFSSSL